MALWLPRVVMLLALVAVLLPLWKWESRLRVGWRVVIAFEVVLLGVAAVLLWVAHKASASV